MVRSGTLRGSTGGNERDVVVYSKGGKAVRYEITYGEGDFHFQDLECGEYMVLSAARIASRVPIRPDQATNLRFFDAALFSPPNETWSPACVRFGQATEERLRPRNCRGLALGTRLR